MSTIDSEHFTKALKMLLDETFDNVQGFFLDKNTSLFETLAGITASEASIPVGGKCATLAAQVKHVAFYLEVVEKSVRDASYSGADWGEVWRTVNQVSADEWNAIQVELRDSYNRILPLIKEMPAWSNEIEVGQAMALVVHTAYHLGEIRQALCFLKP
jgi:hypothetical protein